MKYVLLIALFVTALVWIEHGFLPGLAAGVGTFAGIFLLLLLIGRWVLRGETPVATAEAVLPPWEAIPDDEAFEPRDSDRPLPRDLLPYPLGGAGSVPVSPGLVGRECYLQPLRIDLGATPCCWSWRAATWIKDKAAHEVFAAQLYERLHKALAETGTPTEDATPLVHEEDLSGHRAVLQGSPRFLAFRSRDARWGGFMHGEASFRFPLERLIGLHLRIGYPGRGSGGYELCVVLAEGDERTCSLESYLAYSERTTSSLLMAVMRLGRLFDIRVGSESYVDEWRGTEANRPYDR